MEPVDYRDRVEVHADGSVWRFAVYDWQGVLVIQGRRPDYDAALAEAQRWC